MNIEYAHFLPTGVISFVLCHRAALEILDFRVRLR